MVYKKGKSIIYLILFIIVVFLAVFLFLRGQRSMVIINDNEIKVEIVRTAIDQYRGLSGRDHLCWDCGMLFAYKTKDVREFVMRDMNFFLDIIYISDGRVVKTDVKLRPEGRDPLAVYNSGQPIDYALEVNGGYCEEKNIKVGDRVQIK